MGRRGDVNHQGSNSRLQTFSPTVLACSTGQNRQLTVLAQNGTLAVLGMLVKNYNWTTDDLELNVAGKLLAFYTLAKCRGIFSGAGGSNCDMRADRLFVTDMTSRYHGPL